jgi:7-cyano-7-deazaguanine synthase
LKEIKGSYAIICYDKKKDLLYVGKNFMPLRIHHEKYRFKFASITEMFEKEEENVEMEPYTCYEIHRNGEIKKHSLYNNERNKKVLVICSGGTDSVTTAFIYRYYGYDVNLLHFNYGQAAQEAEQYAVTKIAKILNADLKIIDAKPIFGMFKNVSLLLKQKKANKKDKILDAESTLSYVPNRNALFAMIAGGIAEMNKIDTVAFGGQQMDGAYPDNNPTFVDAVDNLLKYSLNWQVNVKFSAPLIHCMKHEIYQIGKYLNVPYDWVISCYYPKIIKGKLVACNECGCCQFRRGAMEMIGYEDRQSNTKEQKSKVKKIGNGKAFLNKYVKGCL